MESVYKVFNRISEINSKINSLNYYKNNSQHNNKTINNDKNTNPTKITTLNMNDAEKNNKIDQQSLPDKTPFRNIILEAAKKHNISPHLINAIIKQESNYDPYAVSSKGASGLMQLMPKTAKELKINRVFSPKENINGGTRYFSKLMKTYNNDIVKSLSAYNAGMLNVKNKKAFKFKETNDYIQKIITNYKKNIGE